MNNSLEFFTIQDCHNVVKNYLKSDLVEPVDFAVIRLKKTQNFLIKITVIHNNQQQILNFFAKSAQNKQKKTPHDTLVSDFKKTIPEFDARITPKLYYGNPDVLLFEDLTLQGFKTHKTRFGFLNLDHVEVALRVLAKFHAGGLAYEEIKSRELGRDYRLNEEYKLEESNPKITRKELKSLEIYLENHEQFENLIENVEKMQASSHFRKTLCHSNLSSGNIMFKTENGSAIDCKLINFKSKYYAPPIYDVLQLIFFNTSQEFRQHHLEKLIIYYYNVLKQELVKYSLKIEDIQSFEHVEASANFLIPLIKLETAYFRVTSSESVSNALLVNSVDELKEILAFPRVTREDCYIVAKNKIGNSNYEFVTYSMVSLDESNGFLGDYHKLKIQIVYQNEEKVINCFVKCMPRGSASKDLVKETGCFFKEIFIYQTLVPQMLELGINIANDFLARCYFQRNEDFVIFEDLSLHNYKSLSSRDPFNFEILAATAKKVARFHASSFIYEEKISEELGRTYRINQNYSQFLQEIFFKNDETNLGSRVFTLGVRSIKNDVVELFPDLKEQHAEAFAKAFPKLTKIFFEAIKTSERFRNVVCHGDLWTNNILVKFDEEKKVSDCLLVDFQNTRYCPPAHDLLSVLYLTTDREMRQKHGEQIKEIYYNELATVLASFNCNVNKILSYKDFCASLDYIKPQIVMQAIMYSTFGHCTAEEIASFLADEEVSRKVYFEDRKEFLETMCAKSDIYKNKIRECMMDLYDICYFINKN